MTRRLRIPLKLTFAVVGAATFLTVPSLRRSHAQDMSQAEYCQPADAAAPPERDGFVAIEVHPDDMGGYCYIFEQEEPPSGGGCSCLPVA